MAVFKSIIAIFNTKGTREGAFLCSRRDLLRPTRPILAPAARPSAFEPRPALLFSSLKTQKAPAKVPFCVPEGICCVPRGPYLHPQRGLRRSNPGQPFCSHPLRHTKHPRRCLFVFPKGFAASHEAHTRTRSEAFGVRTPASPSVLIP